jgi:hypothetical protein
MPGVREAKEGAVAQEEGFEGDQILRPVKQLVTSMAPVGDGVVNFVWGLCEDGTVWRIGPKDREWTQLPEIPDEPEMAPVDLDLVAEPDDIPF